MQKHKCIKISCDNTYEENDPDAYYCFPCREANKKLAKELDKKIKPTKTQKSDYQIFEEQGRTAVIGGRKITFMRAK